MSSAQNYLNALYRRFQLLGAWPPNQRVEVGEVGVLEQGAFRRASSLGRLGIPFSASSAGQVGDFETSEGAEISVESGAGGQVAWVEGAPRVGVRVKLAHQGAFVFNAIEVVEWRIDDSLTVERHVLALLARGAWDPSWVIVDRVLQARSLTVLVCEGDNAELGLEASGSLGVQGLRLADAALGLRPSHVQGNSLRFLGEVGLTPLYQCLRVRQRLFSRDSLEAAGPLSFGLPEPAEAGEGLERVTLDLEADSDVP